MTFSSVDSSMPRSSRRPLRAPTSVIIVTFLAGVGLPATNIAFESRALGFSLTFIGCLLIMTSLTLIHQRWLAWRRLERLMDDECPTCGHPTVTSNTCPECGSMIPRVGRGSRQTRSR